MIQTYVAAALSLLVLGCVSTSADKAPQFSAKGNHPTGWIQNHWANYVKNPVLCGTCHGSVTDPLQAGGIAKVSCFTCHNDGVNHPANWRNRDQHGRSGAQAALDSTDGKAMVGFAHCTKCHGDDYSGGISGSSCKTCHTKAPHPAKPWLAGNASVSNHSLTHESNAAECAKCHRNGANSTHLPSTPAPPLTAPGCYNNTLCHDRNLSSVGLSNLGR